MKKRIVMLATIFLISCLFSCCGSSTGSGEPGAADKGLFSGAGGWKAEEGIIILLDDDGTGSMLSEVKMEGDTSNLNIPSVYKADITWSEEPETVTIKTTETEYIFQKKKEGDHEALELSGYTYARLDDDAVREYKVKAESAGTFESQKQEVTDSRNEEIVMDEPITIIDNDMVTVNITRFFREVYNEGTNNEYVSAGFEIEADNKTEKYELDIFPRDCSLSDRHVIEFSVYGNNNVAPGKIATMKFIRMNNEDFENLESLYELEGNLDIRVIEDNTVISNLSDKHEFSIPKAMNKEAVAKEPVQEEASAEAPEESEASAGEGDGEDKGFELSEEEIDEQLQGRWVLNAGSGGVFSFDDGVMTVESNGMTLTGTYEIKMEGSTIDGHFTSSEGKKVTIHMPFTVDEDGELILMNNANVPLDKV